MISITKIAARNTVETSAEVRVLRGHVVLQEQRRRLDIGMQRAARARQLWRKRRPPSGASQSTATNLPSERAAASRHPRRTPAIMSADGGRLAPVITKSTM